MSSMTLIPKQAAIAVADLVDNCAKVKPGMNVLDRRCQRRSLRRC